MSVTQTATVETLVAEVRVLMVGSRQVTLSVAKQIDVVELDALTPFGRVRVDDEPTVIGVCLKTGALVKARYSSYPAVKGVVELPSLEPALAVCSSLKRKSHIHLSFKGRTISPWNVNFCEIEGHSEWGSKHCGPWDPGPHVAAIEAAIAGHDAYVALEIAAAKLPLIVLAGLK